MTCRVHRQRRLVADQAAGPQAGRDAGSGVINSTVIRLAGRVGQQRHDHDDDLAVRDRRGCIGGRGEQASLDGLTQPLRKAGLAGKRRAAAGHQVHHHRTHVGPANADSLTGDLYGKRQADLAESDDGDPAAHPASCRPAAKAAAGWPASPASPAARVTALQSLAAASIALATSIVLTPCRMVTMSAGFPSTASRKFSSSVASASRLATAYRIRSPSDAPWN